MRVLVLPPALLWLLLLLGGVLWRLRRRAGRAIVITALLLLYAVSTPLVGNALLRSLEDRRHQTAEIPAEPPAQAIVVLSAGRIDDTPDYGGDTVDRLSLERVRYAARLHRLTRLPILTSGGALRGESASLAHLMRDTLEQDFGVPVAWTEDLSRTTAENGTESAAVLLPLGIRRIYLVTHAWHLQRAEYAFTRAGFIVLPAGTAFTPLLTRQQFHWTDLVPQATGLLASSHASHEWLGLLWYRLTGGR